MSLQQALVIDDNTKNIEVLERMLSKEGFRTVRISQPSTLHSVLKQNSNIRVVFLDIEMPGIDGYQVLDTLKSDSKFANIPIIAYTVHVSEIQVALDRGFDGFIGKPLDSDKFPDQLSRIMAGKGVWEIP